MSGSQGDGTDERSYLSHLVCSCCHFGGRGLSNEPGEWNRGHIIAKDGTLAYSGAIDSIHSTDVADTETAEPLFANALDAVIAGTDVPNAKNKPYGCGVKY